MNLGDLKTKVLVKIRKYSKKGVLVSSTQNADILNRIPTLADYAQKEIAQKKKIPAVYSLSRNPIENQLGVNQGFDIVQILAEDYSVSATGSQAYYFEVDRPCSVVLEEYVDGSWVTLNTLTIADITGFTGYKGLITPSSTSNTVRVRFVRQYPYNVRNTALYAYAFASVDDIPVYRPRVKYTMPTDFMELDRVIHETDGQIYQEQNDFYWEGKRTLVVKYDFAGSFDIHYFKHPTAITNTTEDSYNFEVDLAAQEAIVDYVAGHILLNDPTNQTAAIQLINEYQLALSKMFTDYNYGTVSAENIYGEW